MISPDSATRLLYLEEMFVLSGPAVVVAVSEDEGRLVVTLDQTLFYPQGGGQPADFGTIESPRARFSVNDVRMREGSVRHIGFFESGQFRVGDEVTCRIDGDRRALHSRIHSAGHLIDMAVNALDLPLTPGKGYHFPDGPYVEYAGDLPGIDRELLREQIDAECRRLLAIPTVTSVQLLTRDEMAPLCRHVPDYVPEVGRSRLVLYGEYGIPCGGTHVASFAELDSVSVRKLKVSSGSIRVSYQLSP